MAEEWVWGAAGDHFRNNSAEEREWGAAGDRCHDGCRLAPQHQRGPANKTEDRQITNAKPH